jgi:hypothetical protein
MGMNHTFEFFDRAAVDHLWNISWKTLLRRNPQNAWLQSTERVEVGTYDFKSLRGLLTFCVQQSPKRIETILETRKVAHTLKNCAGQLYAMSELMTNALPHSDKFIKYVEIHEILPLIAIAWDAFLSGRISRAILWSVVKLHSLIPADLEEGSQLAVRAKALLPWHRMWDPIYSWQGNNWFRGEQSTNCLGVAGTRRFITFVLRAGKENWTTELQETPWRPAGTLRFRDDPNCVRLANCIRKTRKMKSPCVHRMWR